MQNKPLSPKKYISTKARELPFHESFINHNWEFKGLASIFLSKKMPGGNYIVGVYLVDIFCLGIKNTFYNFNLSQFDYQEFYEKFNEKEGLITLDLETIHNIIYGAVDYAEDLGFKPQADFKLTEYILNPDLISGGIDEIEFGRDGKPFFIVGPDDNINRIIATLNRAVGEGNYDVLYPD